jgi:soluble lytic murein transglycosylase
MPVPKASARPALRFLLPLLFLGSSIALAHGQVGGAFGMDAKELAALLAGRDPSRALSMDDQALGDTGGYGPSAWYYLARWLEAFDLPSTPEAGTRTRLLYRRAFDQAGGIPRREAGLALILRLKAAGLWEELLAFSSDYRSALGPEWRSERPRLDALDALGRDAEALALVGSLRGDYPGEAAREGEALAYFAAAARLRSGGSSWAKAFRRLLLERPGSEWTDRAFSLIDTQARLRAIFSPEELHALAMRAAVRRREYGRAYTEALLAAGASMGQAASQAMIADAGRAFLYGGALKEGAARFTAQGWTARYYRARFARGLERWDEAATLFRKAAFDAPSRVDADSARWYAAECSYRGDLQKVAALPVEDKAEAAKTGSVARRRALDELVADSRLWLGPESFSDLANQLFRDALGARDWGLLETMSASLAPKLLPELSARVTYTAARAFELDLGERLSDDADPESRRAAATVRFAAVADSPRAPLHYRALAAWRAGIEPSLIPAEETEPAAAAGTATAGAPQIIGESEAFVAGLASFGLGDLAVAEARSRSAALDDEALRRLAALLSSLSRPDCALRLALQLSSRPGYQARRSDCELLYPRPFLDMIRSLRRDSRPDEGLALGLLRSESLFNARAVSSAGAIGLSQLMPATAADQARALGLSGYDLGSPKDNLTIGLAHFSSLLDRTGGRPLRAMMAYNAGWGRLRAWMLESGELPDDLMIETLGIEETRQYCRNILQASVMYGLLYYGRSLERTVGELVEGGAGAGG